MVMSVIEFLSLSLCLDTSNTKRGNNSLPLENECLFIERLYLDEMQAGPTGNATVKPIVYHFSSKLYSSLCI